MNNGISPNIFRERLRRYERYAAIIEENLTENPNDWSIYQEEFNSILNQIFLMIIGFIEQNDVVKVKKLESLFIDRYRSLFLKGEYNARSLCKPFGYSGDFQIIDDIYSNATETTGFARLFDNYFQMSPISVAVRNRKEDFKKFISDFVKGRDGKVTNILDLASGPCREIWDLFEDVEFRDSDVRFYCYDHDSCALAFGKEILKDFLDRVFFVRQNIIRMGSRAALESITPKKYDFIYSTGLFDYFDYKVTVKLIRSLKKLLNSGGCLVIANVREKHTNPSVYYMEWVGEWKLFYKDDDEFRSAFLDAGFRRDQLDFYYEHQEIFQYVIAHE